MSVPERLSTALADRYRIESELGQGGMATVYLALDLRHDRRVAVKVLKPELAVVIGAERFLAEIKTTASLQHPHILPLFDSGVADSFLFYVMPFVEGETLRSRLTREHQLPVADTVRIATDIASALEYAHRRGVIHRDIKPENILLHEGRPQVADFGIALAVQQAGGSRMTQTGISLGTPQYMAPEQAMGDKGVDARADIYALGAVTYEMLVGEPPFTGPTSQAIVAKVMTETPRPLVPQRKSVPSHVEAAVLTALEKLPADRFASTAEFAAALGNTHFTGNRAAQESSGGPRRSDWRRQVLTGLVMLALGVAAGWLLVTSPPTVAVRERRTRLTFSGNATFASVSPDGRWLAYMRGTCDDQSCDGDLMVQELPKGPALAILSDARRIGVPVWSPDGAKLLIHAQPAGAPLGVYLVPRAGGLPRRVYGPGYGGYAFRNDSIISLTCCGWHSQVLVNLITGAVTDTVKIGDGQWIVARVYWQPHGSFMVFRGGRPEGTQRIGIADTSGRLVDTLRFTPYGTGWEADGAHILATELTPNGDLRIWQQAVDASGRFTGPPALYLADLQMNQLADFDLTPTGYVIADAGITTDVWSFHLPDGAARRLTHSTAYHQAPAVSPDGRLVAYVRQDGVGGNIYIVPSDGGRERPVTADSGLREFIQWLPDQQHLSSTSDAGPAGRGFANQIDELTGGRQHRLSLNPDFRIAAWLPDGRSFLTKYGGDGFALADTGGHILREFPLPDTSGYQIWANLVVSPDGVELAMAAPGPAETRIYALHIATGVYRLVGRSRSHEAATPDVPGNEQSITLNPAAWATDGFIYLSRFAGHNRTDLWRIPARGGSLSVFSQLPVACSTNRTAVGPDLTLSRDARTGACIVADSRPDLYLIERGASK